MSGERRDEQEVIAIIEAIASRYQPELVPVRCAPLTPDASLRRYFRIEYPAPEPSVIAMWFDSVACPEASGGRKMRSDDAYVELSEFFFRHGVAVPRLLYDARPENVLLIEDLGDTPLAELILDRSREEGRLEHSLLQFVLRAVEEIAAIQGIKNDGCLAFERRFTAELYVREMEEFRDYVLTPRAVSKNAFDATRALMEHLGPVLEALPQVLVHRDFHAWNLLIDRAGNIRVIDFQDALMATRPYDLASLLNDRDMDEALGPDLSRKVFQHFLSLVSAASGASREELSREYDLALLQRDLKVSGRFEKLASVRGLSGYLRWVPGTVRRIGSTLERIVDRDGGGTVYHNALQALRAELPEIDAGARARVRLDG